MSNDIEITRKRKNILPDLLVYTAGILLLLSPFVLFKSVEKNTLEGESKREIAFLSREAINGSREWKYLLKYHDPRSFLFPEESLGFSQFRSDNFQFTAELPPLYPEISKEVKSTAVYMKEAVLSGGQQKIDLYDQPIIFTSHRLSVQHTVREAAEDDSRNTHEKENRKSDFLPVICSPDGTILCRINRRVFPQNLKNPTQLLVTIPQNPVLPRQVTVLESCGDEKLDGEACRALNEVLLEPTRKWEDGSAVYVVIWQQGVWAAAGQNQKGIEI